MVPNLVRMSRHFFTANGLFSGRPLFALRCKDGWEPYLRFSHGTKNKIYPIIKNAVRQIDSFDFIPAIIGCKIKILMVQNIITEKGSLDTINELVNTLHVDLRKCEHGIGPYY